MHDDDQNGYDDEAPSKSALKREMTARQALGEALCELSEKELARMPIDDERLLAAIAESRRITQRSALRRHRQYIGKLMRQIEPEPIAAALDALHQERRGDAARFRELETLRDDLIARGDDALADLLSRFPHAERQPLRQLTREARAERDAGRPPAASRRLFRYLRALQESA
jgi:ribosome-associated protein